MAQVRWTVQALEDLEAISRYIENISVQYAEEQAQTIFEKAKQLEKHPLSGRPVPELQMQSIRQILCGAYRIIYEVETEDKLAILTVHHQSRLLENNLAFKGK